MFSSGKGEKPTKKKDSEDENQVEIPGINDQSIYAEHSIPSENTDNQDAREIKQEKTSLQGVGEGEVDEIDILNAFNLYPLNETNKKVFEKRYPNTDSDPDTYAQMILTAIDELDSQNPRFYGDIIKKLMGSNSGFDQQFALNPTQHINLLNNFIEIIYTHAKATNADLKPVNIYIVGKLNDIIARELKNATSPSIDLVAIKDILQNIKTLTDQNAALKAVSDEERADFVNKLSQPIIEAVKDYSVPLRLHQQYKNALKPENYAHQPALQDAFKNTLFTIMLNDFNKKMKSGVLVNENDAKSLIPFMRETVPKNRKDELEFLILKNTISKPNRESVKISSETEIFLNQVFTNIKNDSASTFFQSVLQSNEFKNKSEFKSEFLKLVQPYFLAKDPKQKLDEKTVIKLCTAEAAKVTKPNPSLMFSNTQEKGSGQEIKVEHAHIYKK